MNYTRRINKLAEESRYNEADKLVNIYLKRVIAAFIDVLTVFTVASGAAFIMTAIWSFL